MKHFTDDRGVRYLYMIHFNLTKTSKVRELALENTTLSTDYKESFYN